MFLTIFNIVRCHPLRPLMRTLSRSLPQRCSLHQSRRLLGLEEFFEGGQALPPFDTAAKNVYGRAWSPDELRLKSFDDLHKLWYTLLKELNLLYTQKAEACRVRQRFFGMHRIHKCKLSMARIKTILTERAHLHSRASQLVKAVESSGARPAEGELLTNLHKEDKMRQVWRKRKFRQRISFRTRRPSLFL